MTIEGQDQVQTQVAPETVRTDIATEAAPQATEGSEAPQAYTPNHKYKVYDQEREFPDWAKKVVTAKEHEDNLRTLFSKADGIDEMKNLLKTARTEKQRLAEHWNQIQYLKDNDLDSLFKVLNVPEDKHKQWMLKNLEYHELPPEQRAEIDAQKQMRSEHYKLKQEAEAYRQLQFDALVEKGNRALDNELGNAQYKELQTRIPDLKERVVSYADYVFNTQKRELSAKAAVEEFSRMVGYQPTNFVQPQNSAVIPKVGAGSAGQSPTKKSIRSLKDLRAERIRLEQLNDG